MKSEGKAIQILGTLRGSWIPSIGAVFSPVECMQAMAAMEEWKDQQFKDIIAQVRKWLDEQGKLDQLDLVEFDMKVEKYWEGQK